MKLFSATLGINGSIPLSMGLKIMACRVHITGWGGHGLPSGTLPLLLTRVGYMLGMSMLP